MRPFLLTGFFSAGIWAAAAGADAGAAGAACAGAGSDTGAGAVTFAPQPSQNSAPSGSCFPHFSQNMFLSPLILHLIGYMLILRFAV